MERILKIFFAAVLLTSLSFICMANKKNIAIAWGVSGKKDTRKEVADMAALSDAVYDIDKKDFKAPAGYELLEDDKIKIGTDGFQAAAFRNTTTGQIIISYRGTDDLKDAVADIQLGLDIKNSNYDSQIKQSFDFYNSVTQEFGKDKISLTGHSLGGNLAQIVGAKNQVETNTFNAPGVTESTIEKWVGTIRQSLPIMNHIRQNDSVGTYGKHIGETRVYPDRPIPNDDITLVTPDYFLENHGIRKFSEDIKNNPSFEGKYMTDQELQAARANRAVPDTEYMDQLLNDENIGTDAEINETGVFTLLRWPQHIVVTMFSTSDFS
ncbi:MAG: DUF2974 domain-containing protein [Planctomycetes bacterium]|nr:DUF2974 domain-containing protein [Planctomycetota bacterium]